MLTFATQLANKVTMEQITVFMRTRKKRMFSGYASSDVLVLFDCGSAGVKDFVLVRVTVTNVCIWLVRNLFWLVNQTCH